MSILHRIFNIRYCLGVSNPREYTDFCENTSYLGYTPKTSCQYGLNGYLSELDEIVVQQCTELSSVRRDSDANISQLSPSNHSNSMIKEFDYDNHLEHLMKITKSKSESDENRNHVKSTKKKKETKNNDTKQSEIADTDSYKKKQSTKPTKLKNLGKPTKTQNSVATKGVFALGTTKAKPQSPASVVSTTVNILSWQDSYHEFVRKSSNTPCNDSKSTDLIIAGGLGALSNQSIPPPSQSTIDQVTPLSCTIKTSDPDPLRDVVSIEGQGAAVDAKSSGTFDANPGFIATGSSSSVVWKQSRDLSCFNIFNFKVFL